MPFGCGSYFGAGIPKTSAPAVTMPIDPLLTDSIMPGPRGSRLGTLAMRQQPNLRIICMSDDPDRVTQIPDSCKAITFLRRPFSLSMLAQTVRRVLDDGQPYSASA